MIRVKRNTGFSGMLGKIKIYIDGQEVAKIKQNGQIELELLTNEAKITVSQFGSHSNKLVVQDGQVVEITNSSWLCTYYIIIFIALFPNTIFLPDIYKSIVYFILLIISIALRLFKMFLVLK